MLGTTSQKQIPSYEVVSMTLWEQNAAPQSLGWLRAVRPWRWSLPVDHPAESPADSSMSLSSWKMTAVSHSEMRRKKKKRKQDVDYILAVVFIGIHKRVS